MSTPTDDPADFAACVEHESTYPIGGSCTDCDTKEAGALANRWAAWYAWAQRKRSAGNFDDEYDGPWDPHGKAGSECERLESWVRKRAGGVAKNTAVIGQSNLRAVMLMAVADDLKMSLRDGEALCEAAGWPS